MAILRPDATTTLNGVKINEYLLTKHNPNHNRYALCFHGRKNHWCDRPQYRLDHRSKRHDPCGTVHKGNGQ